MGIQTNRAIPNSKLNFRQHCIGTTVNFFSAAQAAEHLKAKNYVELVDSVLEEHKANELEAVCEVIEECTDPDPTRRPAMRDVTGKLRDVLGISPEAAAPRLSPLWWAELELLSIKST